MAAELVSSQLARSIVSFSGRYLCQAVTVYAGWINWVVLWGEYADEPPG